MAECEPIYSPRGRPARVAAFMSGSGTNVRKLLELQNQLDERGTSPFRVVVIATDNSNPKECNARKISDEYDLPVVELDIRKFYADRKHPRVTLKTQRGFAIREEWSAQLWGTLAPYEPEIGALGGFEPLTNLVGKIPCVNVHPGDLSVLRDGKPYLVGLHTVPIKRAILMEQTELRSSTILATPYTKKLEMDEGPVLMISPPLPIELPSGLTVETFSRPANARLLERVASDLQRRLKEIGDWVVFPLTVKLIAEGRFGLDADGNVYFDGTKTKHGVRLPCPGVK